MCVATIITTVATRIYTSSYHGRHLWYVGVILHNLTLVLCKVCLHTAIWRTTLSFPSYILLVAVNFISWLTRCDLVAYPCL